MTNKEYIAFLAKGKKITKVPADKKPLLTASQWRRKTMDHNNERIER